jgi:hypothetical protein
VAGIPAASTHFAWCYPAASSEKLTHAEKVPAG